MKKLIKLIIVGAIFSTLVSGCTTLGLSHSEDHNREASEQFDRVDKHSSFPAVRRDFFENVNLVELVNPEYPTKENINCSYDKNSNIKKCNFDYDLAFAKFREKVQDNIANTQELEKLKLHRNSVQDKIIGVATSRCNVFKTYLRREQANTNFTLGSYTTAAGVLGALVTGVDASRVLAGTAGILSGVQAEYNSNYYNNLAAHVIVQGIELKQSELLETLHKKRQELSVIDYTMEAAVRDALVFDGSCSTVTGLQVAADSINEQNTPSLAKALAMITAVRAANTINNTEDLLALSKSGELSKLTELATPKMTPLVVSMTKKSDSAPSLDERITNALSLGVKKVDLIKNEESKVLAIFDNAVKALPKADPVKVVITSDDVKSSFKKVKEKIGETDKGIADSTLSAALNKCITTLETPITQYEKAKRELLKTTPNTAERLAAEKQLAITKIDAEASLRKTETVFSEIQNIVQAPANNWASTLKKKDLTKDELNQLTVPEPDASVAMLCK